MKRLWSLALSVCFVSVVFIACSDDGGAIAPVQAESRVEQSSSSEVIFIPSFLLPSSSSSSAMTIWDYMDLWSSSSSSSLSDNVLVDSRDGRIYKTVTIGMQTWMAEDLKLEYNHGSATSFCYETTDFINGIYDSLCSEYYGRVYTWAAAMDSAGIYSSKGGCGYHVVCSLVNPDRGICPEGWHLPSEAEFTALRDYVGDDYEGSNGGTKLKATAGWCGAGGNGVDEFGFSAIPTPNRSANGNLDINFICTKAVYWGASQEIATEECYGSTCKIYNDPFKKSGCTSLGCPEYFDASINAVGMSLRYDWHGVILGYTDKRAAYSVRCIKD